jgi:hypothetical protein
MLIPFVIGSWQLTVGTTLLLRLVYARSHWLDFPTLEASVDSKHFPQDIASVLKTGQPYANTTLDDLGAVCVYDTNTLLSTPLWPGHHRDKHFDRLGACHERMQAVCVRNEVKTQSAIFWSRRVHDTCQHQKQQYVVCSPGGRTN